MSITAVDGEEGVGEGAAGSVKGIAVAVFADLEPDVDVNLIVRVKMSLKEGLGQVVCCYP